MKVLLFLFTIGIFYLAVLMMALTLRLTFKLLGVVVKGMVVLAALLKRRAHAT